MYVVDKPEKKRGDAMGEKPHTKVSRSGRRALTNYVGLGRTAIQSHFRMTADNLPPGAAYPTLQNFDDQQIWAWIKNWLAATYKTDIESLVVPGDKRHSFDPYPVSGERGHYDLSPLLAADKSIRIALVGDWGTGTDEAQTVADNMMLTNPELTIHLGDVYYVGQPEEVEENCLGQATPLYKGVSWRRGSKGSFALNGNHEMYSGGHGYFEVFLPTLGIPSSKDKQQLRSYFCLETPVWRILAIDTGYNSDTLFGNCRLDNNLIDWLRTVIDAVQDKKPTLLLSHHQWFSSFADGDYETPANQIAEFLKNQEIIWIWGHEHRLSIYNKYRGDNGVTAYARCIGHGGMPVETGDPTDDTHQVEYYDGDRKRWRTLEDGTVVGLNGYVEMVIQDSTLTLEYLDINRTSLLKESFQPGGAGGWDGTLVRTLASDPSVLQHVIYEND
jgi:hypothetical protein